MPGVSNWTKGSRVPSPGSLRSSTASPAPTPRAHSLPVPAAVIEASGRILQECEAAVDRWPLDIDGFDDVAPGFARTYQKCLDAWGAVRREPSDVAFHRLRRFTKYHWYQVRILEQLDREAIHERRESLRKLQLALGDAHDIVLLEEAFASLDDPGAQLLQRAIARKEKLYGVATGLCNDLYTPSAGVLVADFSRWWAARRDP